MRWALLAVVAACGDNIPDKTAACQLESAATVQDRKVIGPASPYPADLTLAARDDELRTSIAARRQAAWQVVERVLSPVPLGEPALAQQFGGQPTIPRWQTWYARDDFERVFEKLYRDLSPAQRHARAPLDHATIQAGFAWNATALDSLPDWPEQRYLDYLAQIDTLDRAHGISGAYRVSYSPGALEHLIASYDRQDLCRLAPVPDPYDTDPVKPAAMTSAVEHVDVDACGWHVLGPYQAGAGAQVEVAMHGDGDADIYVGRGQPPTATSYACRSIGNDSRESCAVDGGAPVYVAVFGAVASTVDVEVDYMTEDVADPLCLDGEMPRDAALVKADWARVLPGETLQVFDTSGAQMAARLAGDATWSSAATADPDGSAIYTVTIPNGEVFRLPALHVMTKELDHWLWLTLWWSPDPDSDFGADRPALPPPWDHYKMCVSSGYLEGDPDPRGGQAGTLGDALAAVHGGVGAPTWCSNPFLELGAGNAATNCIGCHQHGGTDLLPEDILASQPHHGATRVRNNFFTDYLWAIKGGRGEELSSIVQAELDYWDANDPP